MGDVGGDDGEGAASAGASANVGLAALSDGDCGDGPIFVLMTSCEDQRAKRTECEREDAIVFCALSVLLSVTRFLSLCCYLYQTSQPP